MKFSINFDSTPLPDRLRAELIKNAGFDSVFLWWSRTDGMNFDRVDTVREADLGIETAHTDFPGINNIWLDNLEGSEHFEYYLRAVSEAKEAEIPALIIHLSSGNTPPAVNTLGLDRFHRMIACAEDNGIILAFENLRITSYLDTLLASTDSPCAKFCFDVGHENIYNGGDGVFEKHCDRIAAFHIHDNHAASDEHLLPFDGNIDWKRIMSRISYCFDRLPFTVEAYSAEHYDPENFYSLAMERAKAVVSLTDRKTLI